MLAHISNQPAAPPAPLGQQLGGFHLPNPNSPLSPLHPLDAAFNALGGQPTNRPSRPFRPPAI